MLSTRARECYHTIQVIHHLSPSHLFVICLKIELLTALNDVIWRSKVISVGQHEWNKGEAISCTQPTQSNLSLYNETVHSDVSTYGCILHRIYQLFSCINDLQNQITMTFKTTMHKQTWFIVTDEFFISFWKINSYFDSDSLNKFLETGWAEASLE